MKLARKILVLASLSIAVLVAATWWLTGTASGTRWLLARATPYLPAELRLGDARGSLLHGVRIDSLRWTDSTKDVRARAVQLDIQLLPLFRQHVAIESFDVDRLDVRIATTDEPAPRQDGLPTIALPVRLSIAASSLRHITIERGAFERGIDRVTFAGEMRDSNLRIAHLSLASDWLALDIAGNVALADRYPGQLEASWRWLESEAGPFAGQLRVDGDTTRYVVQHSLAAPLAVSTTGHVAYESATMVLDLQNEWQAIEWPLDVGVLASEQGELRLAGPLDALAISLNAVARLGEYPETQLMMAAALDSRLLRVERFDAENAWAKVAANGEVGLGPSRDFRLDYSVRDADPSVINPAMSGSLAATGSVSGSTAGNGTKFEFRVAGIDGDLNGFPVSGSGALRATGPDVVLRNVQVNVGANRLVANGGLGRALSVNAEIDVIDLAALLPGAAGSIRGTASLSGSRDRPDVRMNLSGTALAWRDYSLESVTTSADIAAIERGSAKLRLAGLVFGAVGVEAAELSVNGGLDGHDLRATLRTFATDIEIGANGGYRAEQWDGTLTTLAVSSAWVDNWSTLGSSQLRVSPQGASLSQTCLRGPVASEQLCIAGNIAADGPAAFDATASALPLAALPLSLPAGITLRGYLDANVEGRWQESRLNANGRVALRDAAVDATYEDELVSLVVEAALGTAVVTDNRVEAQLRLELADDAARANIEVVADDFRRGASPLAGKAAIAVGDASWIAVPMPGIVDPRATINGGLTIGGTLSAPEFIGEIVLADGAFGVRQTGIEVSDLNLRLAQLAPGQLRLAGSARSGDGEVTVEGITRIDTDTGIRSELRLSGDNFELARLPDWQVTASPDIVVVLDERVATVNGELTIPTAKITVNSIPETAQRPSPDAIVYREEIATPERARRVDVALRTVLGDDVRFAGFGLTTGLTGTVNIRGGSQTVYTGDGRLTLKDGRYKAYGQQLDIERGALIFNGPLDNPQLDVRATRSVGDVLAGIELAGTPQQIRSSVFSDPGMSDAEALSYLLTGRPLTSAMSTGESDTLNNAAFALGVSGAGSITSQIRNELGLETLTIEGGADDGRLIAGKRFGDRLLVEYGYGLIDKLGTLLLRYQLNQRLVLESRTGTVSNLDVVYSVKKK